MCGWGYSFLMLQMWQMLQRLDPLNLPKSTPKIKDFSGTPERETFISCILPHFAADFSTQKPYLCTEFQSALKPPKPIQETVSLPIFRQRNQSIKAEFNLLLCSQMPTMLIYAKIAAEYGISEDRVRKIIRSPRPSLPLP